MTEDFQTAYRRWRSMEIAKAWEVTGIEFQKFMDLLPALLNQHHVVYEEYIKQELLSLLPGGNSNPCNLPFSPDFVNNDYADRRYKLIYLDGLIYKIPPKNYIGDALVKIGKVIVKGDKDLHFELLILIIGSIGFTGGVAAADADDLFYLIEAVLEHDPDEDHVDGDYLAWFPVFFQKHYSSKYQAILSKGLKHVNERVREEFAYIENQLIEMGKK